MKKFVVMSGGFHPFHAGHASLYQQAKEKFPDATVLVCATNVQSDRPFPFSLKKKLAQLSGVPPKDFIEVGRQFSIEDPGVASRIGDPNKAVVIFVRSEKDKNEPPIPWRLGPDGKPPVGKKGQPLSNRLLDYPSDGQPLYTASKHVYMDYLKTVEFGPGITSASQIREKWPTLNDKRKTAMVMSLYPATQKNPQLAQNVVGMFDQVMGGQEGVAEGAPIVVAQAPIDVRNPKKAPQPYRNQGDIVPPTQPPSTEKRGVKGRPGQRPMPTYESANLSVEQLAHISDKALDDAYHYGRSTPGANFGWMANMQSAKAAKRLIDAGETDIETISDAIHKGWNITAAADYKGQLQLDTPTPEDKKLKRAKLAMQSYSQLPEEEKEKDRVVARAMLAALGKTNVSESADYLEEK